MKSHPRSAAAIEADYCYPALPEEIRKSKSLEDFTKELEEFLVEAGDLESENKLATAQGQSRGMQNCMALDWNDDVKNETYRTTVVRADKGAQEYIKTVVAKHYPGFEEEKYTQLKKGSNDRIRQYCCHELFYVSRNASNLAENLVEDRLREWFHDLVYVCLDEEDIGPFLRVFKENSRCYDEESERRIAMMSGEELNLIVKEEPYYKSMFSHYLAFPINEDKIIFHFEDIKSPAAQEALADKLWSMHHSNLDIWSSINTSRLVLISTLMPYEYHIENAELRKLVLSAPTYDLRRSRTAEAEINSVTLKGRIIGKPHYRQSPTNASVLEFKLAIDPVMESNPAYNAFDCAAYYTLADFVFYNFQEGDNVIVMGKLNHYRWTDEACKTASRVEIVCDNVYAVPVVVQHEPDDEENEEDEEE